MSDDKHEPKNMPALAKGNPAAKDAHNMFSVFSGWSSVMSYPGRKEYKHTSTISRKERKRRTKKRRQARKGK